MRVILKEGDKVLLLVPSEGKRDEDILNEVPGSEPYGGPWPSGAVKFRWDDSTKTVIEDTRVTEEEIRNLEESKRSEEKEYAKDASGLKDISVDKALNIIDNMYDEATTLDEVKEATRRILKKMIPFILE